MKKFNCIFPGLYNYILTKDVGMIPYTLSDRYESSITTYPNDDFTYMNTILNKENFTLNVLDNTGNEKKDVINYIKRNAKNIDVLQLYHLRYNLLPYYILSYKIHNRKGRIYLKIDADNRYIDFLVEREGFLPSLRRVYVKLLFKFIDIVSIETERNYNALISHNLINEDKLLQIPNGILKTRADINNKEHILLYVGEIRREKKAIDRLLLAIRDVNLKDWKLVLIGEIQEDMKEFIDEFFKENPHLRDKIILKGYCEDKKQLANEYAKSSIYCFNSDYESFGISTLEAAYHANYLISTDIGASPDIIRQTDYGVIIDHDTQILKETIQKTINNWENIKQDPNIIQNKVYNEFSWKKICTKIVEKLEE